MLWRTERATRVDFLIDAQDYFAALATALESARRSVFLVGWDFHSRVRLRRPSDPEAPAPSSERASTLIEILTRTVRRTPRLHVYILAWDFAPLMAVEREFLPRVRFGWQTQRRIHFQLDGVHPVGASHHEKYAVIDDRLAFLGGIDLTTRRWDTRAHRPDDPRRVDPGLGRYAPFHDLQVRIEGDAAHAIGELARDRWSRAATRPARSERSPRTGQRFARRTSDIHRRATDLEEIDVGIARTRSAFGGRPTVREIEAVYLEAVRRARRSIYIENQYFTWPGLVEALCERLAEADGPEVVIVLPLACPGWLEERTMGALRSDLIRRLDRADPHGRARFFYPAIPGNELLHVHSKLMIVDDRIMTIGSANLSNRSMAVDSECNLYFESDAHDERGAARMCAALHRLRSKLLAEHLGTSLERIDAALETHGSLIDAIEALRGGERTLAPISVSRDPDWIEQFVPQSSLLDPETILLPDEMREAWLARAPDHEHPARPHLERFGFALRILVLVVCVLHFTPLAGPWISATLSSLLAPLQNGLAGWLITLGLFVGLAMARVPVTGLILANALLFGFVQGAVISYVGSLIATVCGYLLGRFQDPERSPGRGEPINLLSDWLLSQGSSPFAAVRLIPIAPFTTINAMAGAARVPVRKVWTGTAIGMLPMTAALSLFADRAGEAIRSSDRVSLVIALLLAAALAGCSAWLRSVLLRRLGEHAGQRP